jgi:hypothetical protein
MFEVGKAYWISYGTPENQSSALIKVLEIEGTWLKVESDELEPMINIASPRYISVRNWDPAVAEKAL